MARASVARSAVGAVIMPENRSLAAAASDTEAITAVEKRLSSGRGCGMKTIGVGTVLCVVLVCAGGPTAVAQDARAGRGALAGPRADAARARTLVKRDFRGELEPLDTTPEEAALELLTLTPEERERVEKIIAERASALDRVVQENISLLLRIDGLEREGMTPDRAEALRELMNKLAPHLRRGSLKDEIAPELEPENERAFTAMVDEYMRELVREEAGRAPKGEKKGPLARTIAVRLRLLGQEIKRSYERKIDAGKAELERVLDLVEATPEQRAEIERLALEYAQETLGRPSKQARSRFVSRVLGELTAEQRKTLIKDFLAR
jgi:hypothetical protein